MEFTLFMKVVATCPETGRTVELSPDGLFQRYDGIGSLVENVHDMTDNYFSTVSEEEYVEYLERLRTEGGNRSHPGE
jgi:hypothetical protein